MQNLMQNIHNYLAQHTGDLTYRFAEEFIPKLHCFITNNAIVKA